METKAKHIANPKWKNRSLDVMVLVLMFLWIPVSIDKLIDFSAFKSGILNQPFSNTIGNILIYTLPTLECTLVISLLFKKSRGFGLLLSTALMLAFTGYIGTALLGAWEKLPCGCGSVISGMSWLQHFFFNLFFLGSSGWGLYLWYKSRGSKAGGETTEGGSAKRQYEKSIYFNLKI
ncbi:MauE/DoxX family redox-associated membrane protein [Sphingobacterium siyangense]|uniref:Methylamine utilisation protein MauE domain-containing protein n=1 Tax=Sphingobacterium siyangense TaxID=459529 RepID=A0A562MKF8_9SPHI|nr:MauE/DoxX family redox-associated membrane protein [Sphingobacterium siyangense]TWI20350.1 hypothetical protein IQ31_02305 [Sphingobacterium siyangense]